MDAEVDAEGNLIPKIDAGEDVLEIIPTVAPKTEHEIVEQLAPSAQPTENVTKDGTRNVESMNGSTIKHLVSLHLFENDFSAAKVVARFALKKGPLNKFVELATDYPTGKSTLSSRVSRQRQQQQQPLITSIMARKYRNFQL